MVTFCVCIEKLPKNHTSCWMMQGEHLFMCAVRVTRATFLNNERKLVLLRPPLACYNPNANMNWHSHVIVQHICSVHGCLHDRENVANQHHLPAENQYVSSTVCKSIPPNSQPRLFGRGVAKCTWCVVIAHTVCFPKKFRQCRLQTTCPLIPRSGRHRR